MKTISLTVPMDYNALTRASDMLHGLAIDLSKEKPASTVVERTVTKSVGDASITETTKTLQEAAPSLGASSTAVDDQHIAAPAAADVFAPKPATNAAEQPAEVAQPAAVAGVEVDSDGLPWDHRIHALGAGGTHNKLKKTQQWKKKRGVDAALVAEVEAELRAAMAAGPANPVVMTSEPAPAPAPAATGGTTTFPALMAAITANGIDQAVVTAAVNAQGLTALPLLAARPDLIPAVATALGV